MEQILRRTWAQIDLDAAQENVRQIKAALRPETKLCATVKADCYGHGYAHTVAAMDEAGADWFAVSNLAEALQLRRMGAEKPILILGYTPPEQARTLALNQISQAVYSYSYAARLSEAAAFNGVTVNAHIKIDTGMGRIGFVYHDTAEDHPSLLEAARACRLPGIYPEGVFMHFSSADCGPAGESFTRLQYDLFLSALHVLAGEGVTFELRHCANSAAILDYPEMNLDMVRAGIILYGLYPSEQTKKTVPLRPLMEVKTVISLIKELPADTPLSYSRTYYTPSPRRVATVPIGYADGYPRALSNQSYMLVNGKKAPVIGNICMDQCMLDVTEIPDAEEGQTVTVFGTDHGAALPVELLAAKTNTINYEIICGISRRVPRVYLKHGTVVQTTDYML